MIVDFATPNASASAVVVSPTPYLAATSPLASSLSRVQGRRARGWGLREESLTELRISRNPAAVTVVVELLKQR